MTLGELWKAFGGKFADVPMVFSMNNEEAVPVRGAAYFEMDTEEGPERVLILTNQEEMDYEV